MNRLARTLLVVLAISPTATRADDRLADGDFTIGPTYTNAPELTLKDEVPRGVVTQFVMNSEDSKIYPGIGVVARSASLVQWTSVY